MDGDISLENETQLYKYTTSILDDYFKSLHSHVNMTPSCVQGCFSCCKYPIWVCGFDALIIKDWVAEHIPLELLELRLAKWREDMGSLAGKIRPGYEHRDEYIAKNVMCPFLTDGLCSIYEVRPIACRNYFSYGIAEDCKTKTYSIGTVNFECATQNIFRVCILTAIKKSIPTSLEERNRLAMELVYTPVLLPQIFEINTHKTTE